MQKAKNIFFTIFFTLAIGIVLTKAYCRVNSLHGNYALTEAVVESLGFNVGRISELPSYTYEVNHKIFRGNFSIKRLCSDLSGRDIKSLVGQKIIIMYQADDPSNSSVFTKKEYLEKVDSTFSTDLRTVMEKYFNCSD